MMKRVRTKKTPLKMPSKTVIWGILLIFIVVLILVVFLPALE